VCRNTGFPLLTRKCVGDRQFMKIWCHFFQCASHNPPSFVLASFIFPYSLNRPNPPESYPLDLSNGPPLHVRIHMSVFKIVGSQIGKSNILSNILNS
jgi:hypothetical protein